MVPIDFTNAIALVTAGMDVIAAYNLDIIFFAGAIVGIAFFALRRGKTAAR